MADELDKTEGLTRREVLKKGAILGGALVWTVPMVQTVGMSAALAQQTSETCRPQTPQSVHSYSQGDQRDGSPVSGARSNPNTALAGPDSAFFSLGFAGWLNLDFGDKVFTLGGANVFVVEVTNNPGSYPAETALVEVSKNLSSWTAVGVATSSASVNQFAVPGLDWFRYVRLTDTSNPADFPEPQYSKADGFDVDVVKVTCLP